MMTLKRGLWSNKFETYYTLLLPSPHKSTVHASKLKALTSPAKKIFKFVYTRLSETYLMAELFFVFFLNNAYL